MVGSSLIMGLACVVLAYLWLGHLDGQLIETYPVPEAFMLSLAYQVQVSTSASALWPCLTYFAVLLAGLSSLVRFPFINGTKYIQAGP